MNDYKELLLGCGFARDKRVNPAGYVCNIDPWQRLTTLDINIDCKPNVVFDLSRLGTMEHVPLPFENSFFNEVHAYEVLEHIGAQGDVECFFAQFREFWRILKPGGFFCATVPHWSSMWAWGDPSHTRIINEGTLVFLERKQYDRQLGKTAMSDYRQLMGLMDWTIVRCRKQGELLEFVLRAIK